MRRAMFARRYNGRSDRPLVLVATIEYRLWRVPVNGVARFDVDAALFGGGLCCSIRV